jgi:hypothetical protein
MDFIEFLDKFKESQLIGLDNVVILKQRNSDKTIILMGENHYTDTDTDTVDKQIYYTQFITELLENVEDINFTMELPYDYFEFDCEEDDPDATYKTKFKNYVQHNHKNFKSEIILTDIRNTLEEQYNEQYAKQNSLIPILSSCFSKKQC